MLNLTRRNALLTAACAGAAFGLPKPVSFIEAALAQKGAEAGKGFRSFKFGKVHGFILNDGVWEKPHDPAFIENVSVEETKAALAAAGIANEVVPIPFNITLLKFGNETVLFDAGRAVGLLPRLPFHNRSLREQAVPPIPRQQGFCEVRFAPIPVTHELISVFVKSHQ